MIEAEVRKKIDHLLQSHGWRLQPDDVGRNVFFEGSVKTRLLKAHIQRLGRKQPDYTLFDGVSPLAVIEAKKSSVTRLSDALKQARDYATRLDVKMVFACNGTAIKSQHLQYDAPLYFNGVEVMEFPQPSVLRQFRIEESNAIYTLPQQVIKNRDELIHVFAELNNVLRTEGIRAGIERFTEFANLLFLKLLSEKNGNDIWGQLVRIEENQMIPYLNGVALPQLREQYGGEVISQTSIQNGGTLKKIVNALHPLCLTSVDEDVKGLAFEHFIQKTTDTQNDLGEYFTPRHIVRFMVKLLDPQIRQTVYDPFCGTGGFLTECFKHISQSCKLTKEASQVLQTQTVFGDEITTTARIVKMDLILFGDGHSGVKQRDSLRARSEGQFDMVLTNMPFSQTLSQEALDQVGRQCTVTCADEAFVLKSFNSLKVGGSMAIVVPEGLLVNRANREFLRFLLHNARIRMIVRLPRGCFTPYTDAKMGIIYLTDKGVSHTDWFYSINVKNDGFDSKRNPLVGVNDLDDILFLFSRNVLCAKDPVLLSGVDVGVVSVKNLSKKSSFSLCQQWNTRREQS